MNIEDLRKFCLSIKYATEDMPFGDEYLVFRVFGKWFAVIPLNDPELIFPGDHNKIITR